jgi:1-deoxy-D-xylulose-5-phosphate reductoisomerase
MKRRIAILGSTGSIGVQTLDVIRMHSDNFVAEILVAGTNVDLLIRQAREFVPNIVIISDEKKYTLLKEALADLPIKVYAGNDAIAQIVTSDSIDMVLTAMVGFAGLLPTLNAIKAKKAVALANKETLVVAGDLITQAAIAAQVAVIPVDSEHSAIFQCLVGEPENAVEKIYLTASGGPFRGKNIEFLKNVTKHDALKHPNWSMGAKITIDSASMMNKGLEAIEAKWLFGISPEQIDVVVHPQSIVHSAVQFIDGSVKAQIGLPDMKLPIQYALGFPERLNSPLKRFSFFDYPNLTFEKPDFETFKCLKIAFDALNRGGNAACIMNAANEIAVEAFLNDKIRFLEIAYLIEKTIQNTQYLPKPSLNDYIESDSEARRKATQLIKTFNI